MSKLSRRQFVQQSLAVGAGVGLGLGSPALGIRANGAVRGANDTIRVAVAGLNGRGGSHVSSLLALPGVQIVCLIDPDTNTYAPKVKQIEDKTGVKLKLVKDVRQALEDPNIDAITIATPNHWHSLMTIWACEAGKDVYVEKPCSHNVHEGRIAVEMARKHNRIVQHGTQSRTEGGWGEVMQVIESGQLGKLHIARALCYKVRNSIGVKPTEQPPSNLDFNLWLGPATEQPYHKNLVHYNWHWFWDFGNGDIGNQGVHQMDLARWGIKEATLPKSVLSIGGRFGYKDQGQTPNTQVTVMDFGDTQLIFEVRGRPCKPFHGQGVGNIFHLDEGIIAGTKFYPKGKTEAAPLPKVEFKPKPGGGNHFANFIEAVRTRRQADLNADILDGHYSSALCHLANISYRLGQPAPFNAKTKAFGDNKDAYETIGRMEEHLKDDVKMDLNGAEYMLGQKLEVDATHETFVDNKAASDLLFREYRAPFVVPSALA